MFDPNRSGNWRTPADSRTSEIPYAATTTDVDGLPRMGLFRLITPRSRFESWPANPCFEFESLVMARRGRCDANGMASSSCSVAVREDALSPGVPREPALRLVALFRLIRVDT